MGLEINSFCFLLFTFTDLLRRTLLLQKECNYFLAVIVSHPETGKSNPGYFNFITAQCLRTG